VLVRFVALGRYKVLSVSLGIIEPIMLGGGVMMFLMSCRMVGVVCTILYPTIWYGGMVVWWYGMVWYGTTTIPYQLL
jgi:hypothetical protein